MPVAPISRATVRMFNKLNDEYLHNACTIITFATAFRPDLARMSKEQLEGMLAKAPSQKRSEYKRDVVAHGLDSKFVAEALRYHDKLLSWMEESMQTPPYLAAQPFSLAAIAAIPSLLRYNL